MAARGNVILAGTFEISGHADGQRAVGGLYRSINGGAFTLVSGSAGTGLPPGPVTSIAGDPSDPNRLYAAVSQPDLPNGVGNANTALFVSNDLGANWTRIFGQSQAGGKSIPPKKLP